MPFGLSRRRNPHRVVVSSPPNHYLPPEKYCCMILRLNIDCNACCRKLRRIVLRMKGIETHMIEKQQRKLFVCGRFVPSDVAIHIRKKMNRRVEILEVQELGAGAGSETSERDQADNNNNNNNNNNPEMMRPPPADNNDNAPPLSSVPMVVYPDQAPSFQPVMPLAYCKSAYSAMEVVEVWDDCECMCMIEEDDDDDDDEVAYEDEEIMGFEVPYWENNYYLDQY